MKNLWKIIFPAIMLFSCSIYRGMNTGEDGNLPRYLELKDSRRIDFHKNRIYSLKDCLRGGRKFEIDTFNCSEDKQIIEVRIYNKEDSVVQRTYLNYHSKSGEYLVSSVMYDFNGDGEEDLYLFDTEGDGFLKEFWPTSKAKFDKK